MTQDMSFSWIVVTFKAILMARSNSPFGRIIRSVSWAISILGVASWGVIPSKAIAQAAILETDIVAFIAEMEYYTNQGNVDALVTYIDPDASFEIASDIGVEPALVRISNLNAFFANGFEGLESHDIDVDVENIEIEGQVATVTGKTVDRSIREGLETVSRLTWTNVIELQEGELKVIQWRSRMTGYAVREVEQ